MEGAVAAQETKSQPTTSNPVVEKVAFPEGPQTPSLAAAVDLEVVIPPEITIDVGPPPTPPPRVLSRTLSSEAELELAAPPISLCIRCASACKQGLQVFADGSLHPSNLPRPLRRAFAYGVLAGAAFIASRVVEEQAADRRLSGACVMLALAIAVYAGSLAADWLLYAVVMSSVRVQWLISYVVPDWVPVHHLKAASGSTAVAVAALIGHGYWETALEEHMLDPAAMTTFATSPWYGRINSTLFGIGLIAVWRALVRIGQRAVGAHFVAVKLGDRVDAFAEVRLVLAALSCPDASRIADMVRKHEGYTRADKERLLRISGLKLFSMPRTKTFQLKKGAKPPTSAPRLHTARRHAPQRALLHLYNRLLANSARSDGLTVEAFSSQLPDALVSTAMQLFDPDSHGVVSRRSFLRIIQEEADSVNSLRQSFIDFEGVHTNIVIIANVVFAMGASVLIGYSFDVSFDDVALPLSTVLVVLSLTVGSSLKSIVSGLLYVSLTAPFDVGDRVVLASRAGTSIVRRIHVLYTEFETLHGKVFYVPNSQLATETIENHKSPNSGTWIELKVSFGIDTPRERLAVVKRQVADYLASKPETWKPGAAWYHLDSQLSTGFAMMSLWAPYRHLHQYANELYLQTGDLVEVIRLAMLDAGISFAHPPQPVVLSEPAASARLAGMNGHTSAGITMASSASLAHTTVWEGSATTPSVSSGDSPAAR